MKAEPKVAVILFPGTNCELEALRACRRAKMTPKLFRWNADKSKLKNYDAFILPGGFSYEDRGRSGIVAAKDPIMNTIAKEAHKGKPVLGICNGAQILVETGLIPELLPGHLEMALTWNTRIKKGKLLGIGFYNDWFYMRSDARKGRSVFNHFSRDIILSAPIASGEGRFTTKEKGLLHELIENEQTLFRFCDKKGNIIEDFPINPNGSIYNLAGVCNKEGNVLALMPHPERDPNKGQPLFDSIAYHLTNKPVLSIPAPQVIKRKLFPLKESVEKTEKPDITITVELIITDNEERTIENTAKRLGFKNIELKKKKYYGLFVNSKKDLLNIATKIIRSGELLNLNKETPTITINEKNYSYDKTSGLHVKKAKKTGSSPQFVVIGRENYAGKSMLTRIKPYFHKNVIAKIEEGTLWSINAKKDKDITDLIHTHIFHNPHAMKIMSIS